LLENNGVTRMPFYTVISDIGVGNGYTHLTQHEAPSATHAVALHLGQLPDDLADDDFNEFVQAYLDPSRISLHIAGKRGVWAWLDAAQHNPRIGTYVIETV
jgi:hypothetical protein